MASPPLIGLPRARIFPALMPIPALCETYLTIAPDAALIESKSSSVSIKTHEENWRVGVLTPAIIGVGREILKFEAAS